MGSLAVKGEPVFESVTFAAEPGQMYVPLQDALRSLHWVAQRDERGVCTGINGAALTKPPLRQLTDGTELVSTSDLAAAGATVLLEPDCNVAMVAKGLRSFSLVYAPKRVEVSLAKQTLRAWEGTRLVMETHISSGRKGSTPTGEYHTGPFRARMHYSTRYHHAPMPWSVQINGHIFIHGFTEVPDYPASHGCIRLPLDGANPAKFFYEWASNGSLVSVKRS